MLLINNAEPRLEDNTVGQLIISNYFESNHLRCVAATVILTWRNVPRNMDAVLVFCRENVVYLKKRGVGWEKISWQKFAALFLTSTLEWQRTRGGF